MRILFWMPSKNTLVICVSSQNFLIRFLKTFNFPTSQDYETDVQGLIMKVILNAAISRSFIKIIRIIHYFLFQPY